MKPWNHHRLSLLPLALALVVASLSAAEPRDPSNATNLYYVIKRLKEQQGQRRQPRDYRQGHQKIKQKLAQIRFEEVAFDGLTLDEVIQFLTEEIRKKDPEKKGVNFMYVGPVATPAPANGALTAPGNAPALDALGNPVVPATVAIAPATPELGSVIINLRQPLRNLTALQVLDVVAKTADQPIRFGINNYAVVAMPRAPGSENISGATLRAGPDTFGGGNLVNPVLAPLPVLGNQSGQGGRARGN